MKRIGLPPNGAISKDRWAAALSILFLFSTAACSASVDDKPEPEYRENPSPQQAYRLTMRIDDAPGPLQAMVSAAQYDVVNHECLPPPKDNPGGHSSPVPTHDISFELTQVSEGVYSGVVYADGMVDGDYHGRGVCHWALIQAQVQLKATGADGETKFIASLGRDEFLSGDPVTLHFIKKGYPRHPDSTLDEPFTFGQADRSRMASYLRGEDLFSIALQTEEASP